MPHVLCYKIVARTPRSPVAVATGLNINSVLVPTDAYCLMQ